MNSAIERFGPLEGLLMECKIDECYLLQEKKLAYFKPDGSRVFYRHPLNDRDQDSVKAEYTAGVLKKGVQASMRGRPCCIPKPDEEGAYYLFTNASLTMSFYDAHEKEPINVYVNASLEQGLPGVKVGWVRSAQHQRRARGRA